MNCLRRDGTGTIPDRSREKKVETTRTADRLTGVAAPIPVPTDEEVDQLQWTTLLYDLHEFRPGTVLQRVGGLAA